MNEVPLERLVDKTGGRFVLAVVAAERAKEINAGAKVLASRVEGKPHAIAFREIAEGHVEYEIPETV